MSEIDPAKGLPIHPEATGISELALRQRRKSAMAVIGGLLASMGTVAWAVKQLDEGGLFYDGRTAAGWSCLAVGGSMLTYHRQRLHRKPLICMVAAELMVIGGMVAFSDGPETSNQPVTSSPQTERHGQTIEISIPNTAELPCTDVPPHSVQPGESTYGIVQNGQNYTAAQMSTLFAQLTGAATLYVIRPGEIIDVNCE